MDAPARPERPDRWVWFNHLMQLARRPAISTRLLQYVDEGEKDDCEHNQGQRRNDYELRRAQLQCKHGSYDDAQGTFDRLIARMPSELRYQGSAAEAMLSARQGKRALQYAEKGLAGARQQNNRDMESVFQRTRGGGAETGDLTQFRLHPLQAFTRIETSTSAVK